MSTDAKFWTAPERLYLDSRGRVCGAKDPDKQSLLVPAGGRLPLSQALALGLVTPAAPAAEPAPVVEIIAPAAEEAEPAGEPTDEAEDAAPTAKLTDAKPSKKKTKK